MNTIRKKEEEEEAKAGNNMLCESIQCNSSISK